MHPLLITEQSDPWGDYMSASKETVHGFVMLRSYYEAIRDLPDNDRLCIVDAIFRYVFESSVPENLPPHLTGYFILLRPNIDSSVKKYAAQKANGTKGGRPPKPKNNPSETQTKPKHNQDKEKDKDKEICTCAASQRSAHAKEFATFWKAYPKKQDKQRAMKAFDKAMKQTDLETMLAALEVQKHSADWKKDGGQYIPLPTTWLNGCRWEDEAASAVSEYSYVPLPDCIPDYD